MPTLEWTALTAADGTTLRRWERTPPDATEAVVFVHGATYGARSVFDPEGASWLAAVSDAGRAAHAIDVRGYGDSDRPPALEGPATEHSPVVRASTAATDVATGLQDLHDRYDTVHLVGYSWGTMICGLALTEVGVDVASLVQYAPVYHPAPDRADRFALGDPPAAYRTVTRTEARERWATQRPEHTVPEDAFEAFWEALADSSQRVAADEIIAPNGTLVDLHAAIEDPQYDAAAIDTPTLVVRGSLDTASTRADALELCDTLRGVDWLYTEIAGGTHFLQLESNRDLLYDTVRRFHDRIGTR